MKWAAAAPQSVVGMNAELFETSRIMRELLESVESAGKKCVVEAERARKGRDERMKSKEKELEASCEKKKRLRDSVGGKSSRISKQFYVMMNIIHFSFPCERFSYGETPLLRRVRLIMRPCLCGAQ